MTTSRRALLRTGASLATIAGFTGVTGAERTESDGAGVVLAVRREQQGVPDWADWIPDPTAGGTAASLRGVFSYDLNALLSEEMADSEDDEGPTDPMLRNPVSAGAFSVFLWLELQNVGLAGPIVGPAVSGEDVDPENVPADTGLLVGQSQVYLGSFDGSELRSAVDAGAFSETDSDGVYAHDEEETAVTWGDGYVVVASTAEQVNALVGARNGDTDRRHEVDSDYAWLLRTGAGGEFCVVQQSTGERVGSSEQSDVTDFSMFEGSKGFAQSASTDGGELASATTAVVYASEDRVDREALEGALGTEAADRTVSQDGRNVTVTASYAAAGTQSDGGSDATEADDATATPSDGGATPTESGDDADGDAGETDGDSDGDSGGGGSAGDDDGGDGDGGGDGGDSESTDAESSSGDGAGMGALAALASVGVGGYLLSRGSDGE